MQKEKSSSFSLSSLFAAAVLSVSLFVTPAAEAATKHPARGESKPQSMLVFDAATGEVFHQSNPHKQWTTASLNKAMTLHLMFEHLRAKDESAHNDTITISREAVRYLKGYSASTLDVTAGEVISYDLAARSLIAKSAGDVSFAIAEHVSGSHKKFVGLMNETAQSWGMHNTKFTDASGFSKRPHRRKPRAYSKSTSCDMAIMMRNIIQQNPTLYKEYFGATEYEYKGKTKKPRSLFTRFYKHAEGQKSGYLNISRNNLVASAVIGDLRLIGVSLGTYWRPDSNKVMAEKFDAAFAEKTMSVAAQFNSGALDDFPDRIHSEVSFHRKDLVASTDYVPRRATLDQVCNLNLVAKN